MQTFHFGDRCAVSEPVFVAKSRSAGEGEGYLLATIFDEARNASHLAVLDAQHLEDGPDRTRRPRPPRADGISRLVARGDPPMTGALATH